MPELPGPGKHGPARTGTTVEGRAEEVEHAEGGPPYSTDPLEGCPERKSLNPAPSGGHSPQSSGGSQAGTVQSSEPPPSCESPPSSDPPRTMT